jgi:hypothetical protein
MPEADLLIRSYEDSDVLLDLLKLNVGADVALGRVHLTLKGVEAQALLKVRLDNVNEILARVLTTIDNNPQILEPITNGLGSAVQDVGSGARDAVGDLGQGTGRAVEDIGAGTGRGVQDLGSGAGRGVQDIGSGAGEGVRRLGKAAEEPSAAQLAGALVRRAVRTGRTAAARLGASRRKRR